MYLLPNSFHVAREYKSGVIDSAIKRAKEIPREKALERVIKSRPVFIDCEISSKSTKCLKNHSQTSQDNDTGPCCIQETTDNQKQID